MRKRWGVKGIQAVLGPLVGAIALGSLLFGCDRCGDWWGAPDQSQSCKGRLPGQR